MIYFTKYIKARTPKTPESNKQTFSVIECRSYHWSARFFSRSEERYMGWPTNFRSNNNLDSPGLLDLDHSRWKCVRILYKHIMWLLPLWTTSSWIPHSQMRFLSAGRTHDRFSKTSFLDSNTRAGERVQASRCISSDSCYVTTSMFVGCTLIAEGYANSHRVDKCLDLLFTYSAWNICITVWSDILWNISFDEEVSPWC